MSKSDKTDKKVKKADRKTGAKCAWILAAALAAITFGCAQTGSQPARSQTMNNDFSRCIVIIASSATVSNDCVTAEGGAQPNEIFTQTQKNEGSETNQPTAKPTLTVDTKPDVDFNTTGGKTAGVLEKAVDAGAQWLMTPSAKAEDKGGGSGTFAEVLGGTATNAVESVKK